MPLKASFRFSLRCGVLLTPESTSRGGGEREEEVHRNRTTLAGNGSELLDLAFSVRGRVADSVLCVCRGGPQGLSAVTYSKHNNTSFLGRRLQP